MAQLLGKQNKLAAMMSFVGNKVTQKMSQIDREVLPGSGWNQATAGRTELDHVNDPAAAALESFSESSLRDFLDIHRFWHFHTMLSADALDPRASGIVDVRCHPPNGPLPIARDFCRPQLRRQILNKISSYSVVCKPR